MKKLPVCTVLLFLLTMLLVGCGTQTAGQEPASGPAVLPDNSSQEAPLGNNLPLLPAILEPGTSGLGEPLPGGAADPFAGTTFVLATELPEERATAVVEQHISGQLTEEKARQLANQFGFTGPLYIQQIPAEFAPPAGQEGPPVYTAFNGQRILNISSTGLTYEDRGVVVNYAHQLSFAEKAPLVEAQLKAWNLLNFPYQLQELPTGDLVIYRLIDGVPTQQNEFNIVLNQAGEIYYFDYHPLREPVILGEYPLQTAETAWQQLQTAEGRAQIRYQLISAPQNNPLPEFVMGRNWAPDSAHGQERHLYLTPAVFEATDGSGLYILLGEMALAAESAEIAQIATHLGDVLHFWGTVERTGGAKNFSLDGWERLDSIEYLSLQGEIVVEAGQTLLQTVAGDRFILAAAPADIPHGLEVYVSATAERDTGEAYPVLDWNTIDEKMTYPDVPMDAPVETPAAIDEVTIELVELVNFTRYISPTDPQADVNFLFVPVWKFEGKTNDGQMVTFWVPAVTPAYQQGTAVPSGGAGSIFGWVWHDLCATAQDGQPALTSAPEGCLKAASALGDYRADGRKGSQEPAIEGIVVRLGAGACPATGLAEVATIATDVSYSFTGLAAGAYCVSINPSEEPNLSLLQPGIWTYPEVAEGTMGTTVILAEGENVFDVNFGWDHQFLP